MATTPVLQALAEVIRRPMGPGGSYDRQTIFQEIIHHILHCRLRSLPSCQETSWEYEGETVYGIDARDATIYTHCLLNVHDSVDFSVSFMFMNRFDEYGACLEVQHKELISISDLSGKTLEAALERLTEFVVTKLQECGGVSRDEDDSQMEEKEE